MSSPLIHEIKGQAFRFLKDKIKTARLVLTDVTPVQLMVEEATSVNPWPPDTRAFKVISHASFEVDEYDRVVEILHRRLSKFDKRYWRASYKALILLEHLLTHGPKRVSDEFHCLIDVIEEIQQFQHVDEKGFNWGLSVGNLSERISKLLRDKEFLKEERERTRNLSRGIQGFGCFSQPTRSATTNERLNDKGSKVFERYNSCYECDVTRFDKKLDIVHGNKGEQVHKNKDSKILIKEEDVESHHPFVDQEEMTTASLLTK